MVTKCPTCGSVMIPYRESVKRMHNGAELTIENFPVRKCVSCDETLYGTGSLIKYVEMARKHFEATGETSITV